MTGSGWTMTWTDPSVSTHTSPTEFIKHTQTRVHSTASEIRMLIEIIAFLHNPVAMSPCDLTVHHKSFE